jgi:1-aminocyclopropane-1-carboxylate deaminase/D-cysteine desulfhydrase-like pyridoxal-dependent ACC family enzyme
VLQQAREGARLIGYEGTLLSDQVTITSAFVGAGYGIPTDESLAAGKLWARTEGVVLDPTYTSKAAIRRGDRIVFWHTGGAPALLA